MMSRVFEVTLGQILGHFRANSEQSKQAELIVLPEQSEQAEQIVLPEQSE